MMKKDKKDKMMTIKVEPEFYDDFRVCVIRNKTDISKVIREFMKNYIETKGEKGDKKE